MIYLASPYSSNPETNYQAALEATAAMIAQGYPVFSPIVHCHPIHKHADLPGDFEFWKKLNLAWLSRANQLWILDIPGWQESVGVQAEAEFARTHGIPMFLVDKGMTTLVGMR